MNSTGWGGLEMNTLKLAIELSKSGVEVHHIVKRDTRYAKEIEAKFESIFYLDKPRKYFDFKNAKLIANHLKEKEVTNVFVSFRADLDIVAIAKRKSRKSIHVIHQQHMLMGITKTGITQRYRYRAIDVWLCPLEILKADVLKNTEVPESKIRISPIGIQVDKFLVSNYSKSEAQKLLNCETDATLIGVIGRIDIKKGQLFLVQAIQRLRAIGENAELLIVGVPTLNDPQGLEYFEALKSYIKNNALSEFVHFSAFADDVTLCYAAIDLLAMPSECETYGMVTLEAMLSKKPVIGTNSGGTPEILDFGNYGELYEVNDVDSFVINYQKLQKRMANKELDLDFIQAEIIRKYSLEREVEAVINAMI